MKFLNLGSISKNLTLLVMLAALPALAILVYSGMEQRSQSVKKAHNDVQLITKTMAEFQKNLTISSRQTLSTLSLLSEIQNFDTAGTQQILKAVLERNPGFKNITLTNAQGDVVVSGQPSPAINLLDRKHVREALAQKKFAVGEYIMTRVGSKKPGFAYAYPILDPKGNAKGVLTLAITLDQFDRIHDASHLAEESFVAITDHKGVRLYYYPQSENTNALGKPIAPTSWAKASAARQSGRFISEGSDGVRRIFAFEQVRLHPDLTPYIYVWAGIPETQILRPANIVLTRNIALMLLVMVVSLLISWSLGRQTVIVPITNLIALVQKFARGDLEDRHEYSNDPDEFETLTAAFYDMADALSLSQKLLSDNESRFRLIMDSLNALVYVADMDTFEVLFINEYGKKVLGDITGNICWKSIQEDQDGPCAFCTNHLLLDKQSEPLGLHSWEFQNTKTGLWFYIHDRAIKWIDGRTVRLEIATDITEMKQVEANLAQESERLAVTLRSIGDGVITTDINGEIVLINEVAEQLTGWTASEARGKPSNTVLNIIHGATRALSTNPVETVLSTGTNTTLDENTLLISKSGQERRIADSGAPIKNTSGEIIGVVLVFRDITEQLQTEKELAKVTKLESIGVLAGGIAHDFNNILTAILGNIELSLSDENLSTETQLLLSEAQKASRRAQSLTGQLLTFSKGGEPIIQTSSLIEVVKDSAEFVLHGDSVTIQYHFSEDLGYVDIDRGQISQVIQNIILNARDAMPDGGQISINAENIDSVKAEGIVLLDKEQYVKLQITDTGVGMPEAVQEKIFDPYFSTKKQGSGLGLAITHSIINKHSGYIGVKSEPERGTTFSIYLPSSEHSPTKPEPKTQVQENKNRATVLVMDDEPSIRAITQRMLGKRGHTVISSESGEEALQKYKAAMLDKTAFDVVILDLTIPGGMGGKETIEQLLILDPDVKAIVSSGYSNDPVMANFQAYGFSAAIVKPYLLKDLVKVIDDVTK